MRLLLPIAVVAALLLLPSLAGAETLAVTAPVSDNYKASYNADPSRPELRTWLSMGTITAGGTTWAPAPPAAISFTGSAAIAVRGADGRSGVLSYATTTGPFATAAFRSDPEGRWGAFLTLSDRSALAANPGRLDLTLQAGGVTLATGTVEYRATTFSGDGSAIESNGPGGRWMIGGQGIRTDWEPVPASPVTYVASAPSGSTTTTTTTTVPPRPRITALAVPTRTSTRTISVGLRARAVNGQRIRYVHFAIGSRGYGRWVRIATRYSLRLPAVNGTVLVRAQVRDAGGALSSAVARRVRCSCR